MRRRKPGRPPNPKNLLPPTPDASRRRGEFLAMDYPLRPDFLAQVVLPRDMTKTEADRLCDFVRTLASGRVGT